MNVAGNATLAIVQNGANVDITFASVSGAGYRLLTSNDQTTSLATWANVGTLTATGATSTFSVPTSGAGRFFVVVCQ